MQNASALGLQQKQMWCGRHYEGRDLMSMTPKCDMFLKALEQTRQKMYKTQEMYEKQEEQEKWENQETQEKQEKYEKQKK